MAVRLDAGIMKTIGSWLCFLLAAAALAGCDEVLSPEQDYLSARDEVDALRASVESDIDSLLRATRDLSDALENGSDNQVASAARRFERAFEDLIVTWDRYSAAWNRLESAGAVYTERWHDYEGVLLREVHNKLRDRVEGILDDGEDLLNTLRDAGFI